MMSAETTIVDNISSGGVTLRSLLEKRDLVTPCPSAKSFGKEYIVNGDPYADVEAALLEHGFLDKSLSDFKPEHLNLDDLLGNNNTSEVGEKMIENGLARNHENAATDLLYLTTPQEQADSLHLQDTISYSQVHSSQQQSPNAAAAHPAPARLSATNIPDSTRELHELSPDCKYPSKELSLPTIPGEDNFNPASVSLQDEDLKPQPIIKKSQKHYVPDSLKDDRYWARRRKNNLAAKRSREARRIKENQIVLRASYLEKENNTLKEDVMQLRAENDMLRNQLKKLRH